MTFIPAPIEGRDLEYVPYFDDIYKSGSGIPGSSAKGSIEDYQMQIEALIRQLNATHVQFVQGHYPGQGDPSAGSGQVQPDRYGYQILFRLNGNPGRIDVAALPIRRESRHKIDRAKAQALFLVRDWLQSEVYSHLYRPGSITLIPYLIGDDGRTVTETLLQSKALPMLQGGHHG